MAAAKADSAALIAAFAAPPGSVRRASEPNGAPSALNQPPYDERVATKVLSTGWWTCDLDADAVYAWLMARQPAPSGFGALTATHAGQEVRTVTFSQPSTAMLAQRSVMVTIAPLPVRGTVLRVDAQDVYRLGKPAAEVVPATGYLRATIQGSASPAEPMPSPRTVALTDRARIATLAGMINALPRALDAVRSCPAWRGASIVLDFRDAANGADRASVELTSDLCAAVAVDIGGTRYPGLDASAVPSNGGLAGEIASVLGVPIG